MQSNSAHQETGHRDYWGRHPNETTISLGEMQLSPASNRVSVGKVQIFLRPMEFRLLHFFMTHPDTVHTRENLLEEIWGDWIVIGARTVDVHIRRLRATLQPFGLDRHIQTVHCRGYLYTGNTQSASPATSIN